MTDLRVTTMIPAPHPLLAQVILHEPARAFIDWVELDRAADRDLTAYLEMPLGPGARIVQRIDLAIGEAVITEDAVSVSLRWQPRDGRYLPAFAGELEAKDCAVGTLLAVHGSFATDVEAPGLFGSGVAGHSFANQALELLVGQIAQRLEREIRRTFADEPSELFLG